MASATHPDSVEFRSLAIVRKLACQNRLDMFRLTSKEVARPACHIYLHEIRAVRRGMAIQLVE